MTPESIAKWLFAVLLAGFGLWRYLRMRKALRAPDRDDQCAACGGFDLVPVDEGAYRCNSCGYEGGSGRRAMRSHAIAESIERMLPAERRKSGIRDLMEARQILVA